MTTQLLPRQIDLICEAHALGMLDRDIAQYAGVSLSTVKRYRAKLGLETHSETTTRGKQGERITALEAANRGLRVEWREVENEKYDLIIEGRRVDAKTTMRRPDGTWRIRLENSRASFYGQYRYAKNYAQDCEFLALVCLYRDGRAPDIYVIESAHAPQNIHIRSGGIYEDFKDAWGIFTSTHTALRA